MALTPVQVSAETGAPAGPVAGSVPDYLGRRVPELDGLRGLAIALVLMVHYGANQLHPKPGTILNYVREGFSFGWCGVDLFFVLSGFLIGGILIENRASPNFFKTFYVRRVCRIFPLYYAWLLVTLLLLALRLPDHVHNLVQPALPFWSYFTYTQNVLSLKLGDFGPEWFGPTWSLAIEEQFYLLFPLLVRFCSPRRLPGWLVVLVFSATMFRVLAYFFTPHPGFASYLLLPCRWDSLLLGALTAWLVRRPGFVEGVKQNESFLFWVGGVILATLFGLRLARQGGLLSLSNALLGFLLLAILFCGLLLLALFSRKKWIKAIFTNRWLCKLGCVSYCVYLIHQPVAFLCHNLIWHQSPIISGVPKLMTTVLALGTTLGLALLSWRFFESKCVNWGRKFAY